MPTHSRPIAWKVDKNGCWNCTSHKPDYWGYPKIQQKKRQTKISRFLWKQTNGEILPGLCLCHHCDNTKCINPAHMFIGTHGDNVRDKVRKGRQPRGEEIRNSKLTGKEVIAIRNIYAKGKTQNEIAREYGMGTSAINSIIHRMTWKHIGGSNAKLP